VQFLFGRAVDSLISRETIARVSGVGVINAQEWTDF
jgi:hypothetical protein